jgi:hypothetical protein
MLYRTASTTTPSLGQRPAFGVHTAQVRPIFQGSGWQRASTEAPAVLTTAEMAECGCPEWCHRDHEND